MLTSLVQISPGLTSLGRSSSGMLTSLERPSSGKLTSLERPSLGLVSLERNSPGMLTFLERNSPGMLTFLERNSLRKLTSPERNSPIRSTQKVITSIFLPIANKLLLKTPSRNITALISQFLKARPSSTQTNLPSRTTTMTTNGIFT